MATHQKKHNKRSNDNNKLILAENENEHYAEVVKPMGDCLFQIKIIKNNLLVNAKLRGKFRGKMGQRNRIVNGSIILVEDCSMSEIKKNYQIIHIYPQDHIRLLQNMGKLAQIKTVESEGTSILIENDVVADENTIEIDDDFINDI